MTEINLAVEITFKATRPSTPEDFEAFLDRVVEEFVKIDREVNLAARLGDHFAEFAVTLEAADFETAAAVFLGDVRTALHAADCITSGWPENVKWSELFVPQGRVVRELADA